MTRSAAQPMRSASRARPRSTRRSATTGTPLEWTAVLIAELDRRVSKQVDAWRATSADPALKSMVITDVEVDELLTGAYRAPGDELPGSLTAHVLAAGTASRVRDLRDRFGLSDFECDVVLVCLAPEVDRRFDRLYAYLNDDLTRARPSVDVLMRLIAPRGRQVLLQAHLLADARLLRCGLLVAEEGARHQADLFRLADGVVRFLFERDGPDALVAKVLLTDDDAPMAASLWSGRPEGSCVAAFVERHGRSAAGTASIANLHGRAGTGRAHLGRLQSLQSGPGCLAIDGRKLRRLGADGPATLRAALRDSRLAARVLFIHHFDASAEDADRQAELRDLLQRWSREFGGLFFLGSQAPMPLAQWFPAAITLDVGLPMPDIAAREDAWRIALAPAALTDRQRTGLAQQLASRFRLSQGDIATVAQHAHAMSAPGDAATWGAALHAVVARVATPHLHTLAEAMPATHALDDLVLPADKLAVLHDLVRRVKHRRVVFEDWRYDAVAARGRGLVALFHGASGTGKTMAADAIAHTLGMLLFRIDLAGVVSKYIGETEKNLRLIFDEADRADAVLFFDEADALFGKRSEVKDAHDRYANIEINYLLQKIESFEGIAILATNKRSHIDEAFARRIHVTLEFPLPRASERLRLWDRSFPIAAPLAPGIDWNFLAERFELSGGAIRNAALAAAYLAADETGSIGMREIVNALRTEFVKAGRRIQDSEFGPHSHLLEAAPTAAARYVPRTRPVRPPLDPSRHLALSED